VIITTEYFDKLVAANLCTHGGTAFNGALDLVKIGLIVNTPTLSKKSVFSDLTEPTYTGYAKQSCQFGAPFRDGSGNISVEGPLLAYQMGDSLLPTTVHGYFAVDTAGTHLLYAELFDSPIPLVDTLDYLGLIPTWVATNPSAGTAGVIV
jgi:hypothetical protein